MTVLGALRTRLDEPGLVTEVLETFDPVTASALETRATAASMTMFDLVAVTIKAFIDNADDELWAHLLTIIRDSERPGLTADQTILKWATSSFSPVL